MAKSKSTMGEPSRCSWMCCCRAFLIIFVILSLILAAVGVFLVLQYRSIFMKILANKMPLNPDSPLLESFKNPPADIYMSFRFFNVTNPDEVVAGAKPIVVEQGPYVFKNRREKSEIDFNDEVTEIFYQEKKFYVFDTEKSVGTLDDTFVNLDLVSYGILKNAYEKGLHQPIAYTVSRAKRANPFYKHRVSDFLFGAEDKLMKQVLPVVFKDPATRPPPVFGILIDKKTGASKNGSLDANYTLHTGKGDISQINQIVKYNDLTRLPEVWPVANITDTNGQPHDANIIRGTLGTGFAPDVRKESVLRAFAADLCLTIDFVYKEASKTGFLDTLRFHVDVPTWRKFVGQLNRGMCPPEDRKDPIKCMQDGVLNATNCKGAALMMSLPHLLHADPFYQNLTEGLTPDDEKHGIFLDVDPVTGAALNVAKRMQMNIRMMPLPLLEYKKLPMFTLMPIMWIEESGGITEKGMDGLKNRVHSTYNMLKKAAYALVIFGVALLPITIIIFLVYKQCHNKNRENEHVAMSQVRMMPQKGSQFDNGTPTGYVAIKRQSPGEGYSDEKRPLHA